MSVFDVPDGELNFPKTEKAVLQFWKDQDIFGKQLAMNSRDACAAAEREYRPFVFFEGPPTANGMPHPGHILTRCIKDIFLRFNTATGHDIPRKAGWDTHGLPVEIEVEKVLGIEGKEGIETFGVEPFVRKCKDSVFKYSDIWTKQTERIGFWVDLDDPYVTYHQSYIESVWWALKQFFDAGFLYHGHKIVPYCPRCGTALSSHEVGQGYKEVADPSAFVAFHSKDDPTVSFVAWTTTPWTLLSNVALAVGKDYDYDYCEVEGETLIMASALREKAMGKVPHTVVKTVKGAELVGKEYEPLFPYATYEKPACRVIAGDFVGLDAGSGIVHIAPAFGEDDYRVGMENDLPVVNLVKADGAFIDAVTPWKGRFVKDCDKDIIKELKQRKQLLRSEQYLHDYPYCWRCDSPLLYYARPTWYIRTTAIKDKMLENNAAITWLPEHIKEGRFGNFLETNVDWALSRERYWGTPLPIWTCADCGKQEAVGSIKELCARSREGIADVELHKPYVDEVTLTCSACSGVMKRVTEVIDCWFDSGAMPFAQWGYPHAEGSAEKLADAYPASFISEAIDQTRGWFYSLLAIGTLLKECASSGPGATDPTMALFRNTPYPLPYKQCLVLGHVCDEKGYKMSKSKGNYVDPWEILDDNGADAMRWCFYSSNNPWASVRFSRPAVRDAQKDFLVRLRNIHQFFVIYANIDGFDPSRGLTGVGGVGCGAFDAAEGFIAPQDRQMLDRWILSKLASTGNTVRTHLEKMDIYASARALHDFVDALSNWYVRRSRDRFWKAGMDEDKRAAYWTLYECLSQVSVLIAPFVPFFAEHLYQELVAKKLPGVPESVHLHPWLEFSDAMIDTDVEARMDLVREMASLGLAARASEKLKVRQPLSEAVIILADAKDRLSIADLLPIVADEVNVKAVVFAENAATYVSYEVKPNFKTLGPKLGKDVKAFGAALAAMDASTIASRVGAGKSVDVMVNGAPVCVEPEDLDVRINAREGYVASQGLKSVVVIDTTVTPELAREGLARELINRIQSLRKERDLAYEARIRVTIDATDEQIQQALQEHMAMIASETLCDGVTTGVVPDAEPSFDIDGMTVRIAMEMA